MDIEALVEEAHAIWMRGDAYKSGSLLYEHILVADRPAWAARILAAVKDHLNANLAEVDKLLDMAAHPDKWPEAYRSFEALRQLTLLAEKPKENNRDHRIYVFLLSFAENVAKVVYNASGKAAPFDHDSGEAVVLTAGGVAEHIGNADFVQHIWKVISSAEFLKSDAPVVLCNPHCSVCRRKILGRWKSPA